MIDPRQANEKADLLRNNPLSLEEDVCASSPDLPCVVIYSCVQNPWQQYFQDQEIRATIEQDVVRTYPELEFFQSPEIQQDLTNILFCYSRRHPVLGYRQVVTLPDVASS